MLTNGSNRTSREAPCVEPGDKKMQVERVVYRGWKNAYRISNHTVEFVVTADCRSADSGVWISWGNEFCELPEEWGKMGGRTKDSMVDTASGWLQKAPNIFPGQSSSGSEHRNETRQIYCTYRE